ncbi:5-bromo-4-chloroindolyl phosphate hydrolysis protein [Rhodobacteraceae bacterium THAF1]|uniref:5-bromo-4-chloroindolyl phosphate hydrolysis family protein n=1 Tax=Palleronia sp. THAF1 TaxID=2587842 RepID=UPI000F3F060A|nr:5-bromo-4-chloroindolyl phosphate hydrolysis family protein [Palleronia sp. THAF1]QFU09306.1 5-bromo-4-chloroindolyl phosphate hydrolysis protein [Palleronia sp. THAF1]VDC26701.1 5-bromo-4-chloroindolyl phosphate hydrolysis protein [Rhodobacteraceae bacterium THAF1]
MAQRFGGAHSPGAAKTDWSRKRRSRVGARANALYIAPIPLLFTAFGQNPAGLAFDLAAFFTLMGAAYLTREGLKAHDAYDARTTARRPAIPRKMLGAALTGAGLLLAGLPSLGGGIILAILGTALHVAAFGIDPLRNKMPGGAPAWQSERVAAAVDEAERHLADMRTAIAGTGDRPLLIRTDSFAETARGLFRRVEQDPRDLAQARRWLGVYLLGAKDAAQKYAALAARSDAKTARTEFMTLLNDLEQGFARRTETMLLDDRSDLDVEIEVLRERLDREGLAMASDDLGDKNR